MSAVGAPLAVLADAVTYLYSAVELSRLRVIEPVPKPGGSAAVVAVEVLEGLRWVYRGSGLAILAISTHVWFAGNAIIGVLAPYALSVLGLTPSQFGIIGAAGGVGALLGSAVTTRLGLMLGTGRTIIVCHIITATAVIVMLAGYGTSNWGSVAVLSAGQALYGLAIGISNSHEMSYRQLITPDWLQARTNSTLRSLNRAVMILAAPLAGILADARGIRTALIVAAAIFGLISAGLLLTSFPSVRAPT